jgi:pimeloyl-ACP methyl ester carboxylesterase
MLRASVPSARIEIIPDTGHFPQLDASTRTNALIDTFLAALPAGVQSFAGHSTKIR